jgi:hemerythrin HHE cation binding domain-containing protein
MASKANRPEKRDQRDGNTQKSGGGSAIELLETDHREVEALFQQYEEIEDRPKKELLALKICLSLQVHAQIEEEIFYPAARKAIANSELIDEAIVEHAAAKQLIAEIETMEVGDALRDAKVRVLGEQIAHHVEEEENELFPEVEDTQLDLSELGQRMTERKTELLEQLQQEGEIL